MKSISIRFTDEQKEALEKASKADGRSINSFVVKAVGEKITPNKDDFYKMCKPKG